MNPKELAHLLGADAPLPHGSPRPLHDARAFLVGELAAPPSPLAVDLVAALVACLVERRDADRLGLLAGVADRAIAKEARRGLHQLRARGIAAHRVTPATTALPSSLPVEPELEAWSGIADARGERMVSFARTTPDGGFEQLHFTISDEQGVVDLVTGRGPRRAFRELRRRFDAASVPFAETPLDFARADVARAYALTLALGRAAPQGFAFARSAIGDPPPGDLPHPALVEVPSMTLTAEAAIGLQELPGISGWMAPREVITALGRRLEEVGKSTLFVDEPQRARARVEAVEQAIVETFAGERRARWQTRLLDAALVYLRAGHEDDAGHLRAQADRVADATFAPVADPFARRLIEKLLPADAVAAATVR